MRKLGATGNYPEGSLGKGDEGEISFAVARDGPNVIVNFGSPVAWLGMPPGHAIEFAKALLKHAGAKKIEIEL